MSEPQAVTDGAGPGPDARAHRARRRRDWALTLVPWAGLAGLMAYRGDVEHPHGTDAARPLGHFASLVHSGHIPFAVPLGVVLVVLSALGILGLLGDSPLDLRGDERVTPAAQKRPLWKREGFWLVAVCAALYVPTAGAYGLWDPWETHYSEVAREMLARDDWTTLWWGQEGWFMSKPILIFYLAALGMGAGSALGLRFWSDSGVGAHEWCVRLPIVFFAIAAVYAVYRVVAFAFGRRAGLLCGLVLATMPHWFLLAHQAMTDMPFVAPLVVAMCLLMGAIATPADALVAPRAVRFFGRTLRVSAWHAVVFAIVLVALPQATYLLTRPVVTACADGATERACRGALAASRLGPIQFPVEQFFSGSAGNSVYHDAAASVPGSPAWEERYGAAPFFPSFVQAILWLGLGVLVLRSLRRERRAYALAMAGVYLFSAISFMGKGPAGLGVPEATLVGFVIVSGRARLLARLRLVQGAAIFALCGLPWYVAITARLGHEFIDRFVVHDLLNRAFAGVHGDTGTFRYFVQQLGFATFPYCGLVPVALGGYRLLAPRGATDAQRVVVQMAVIWALVAFTLFNLMVTRFHHYIFPMVPACAVLVGLLLHRVLEAGAWRTGRRGMRATALAGAGTLLGVLAVGSAFGALRGRVGTGSGASPALAIALGVVAVGLLTLARAVGTAHDPAARSDAPDPRSTSWVGALGLGAAVVVLLVARDLAAPATGSSRLAHLFTYQYTRLLPARLLDYRPALLGFALVAALALALLAWVRGRGLGARMLLSVAVAFTAWALFVYVPDLSQHFSQRGIFERYRAARGGRDAPLAAYGMNWKGENFYTGGQAAMIDCGLEMCTTSFDAWLTAHRGERVFVVTEHGRTPGVLAAVARRGGAAHAVTTPEDQMMFVLIEAQL